MTTVHASDDTRIRERLIPTLGQWANVDFACRLPGPSNPEGLVWLPLRGGRPRRWVAAAAALLFRRWDVAVVHDPELIPPAVLARVIRRRPVVFDVHEDLAAQIQAKSWIPGPLRPLFRLISVLLYRLAESSLTLTLAEETYTRLFRRGHPVFPNYPRYDGYPDIATEGDGTAVYVGDVQETRGLMEAVAACGAEHVTLKVVGPVSEEFEAKLMGHANLHGADLHLLGRLPNREALQIVGGCSVGLAALRDLPNYRESLPTKVIEYLAMGLPVVATDLPGTRRAVEGLAAVTLVSPLDVNGLGKAIRESVKRRSLAQSQVEEVRGRFRWPEGAVSEFYKSLVNR